MIDLNDKIWEIIIQEYILILISKSIYDYIQLKIYNQNWNDYTSNKWNYQFEILWELI